MTDQGLDAGGREVSVGTIMNRTMSVVSKNFPVLISVTAIFYLPTLVINYLQTNAIQAGNTDVLMYTGLGGIISAILQFVLIAAITYAVYAALTGSKASFGETIGRGFRFAGPVFVVSLLSGIAVMVGLLLLIIPGIIAAIMLSVAVPALIAERTGIFESLSRSSDLTKGYRWTIFGVFLVWIVIILVLSMIGGTIFALLSFGSGGILLLVIFDWVLSVFFGMVGAVLAPVIYFELRVAKEGLDLGQIASVFD